MRILSILLLLASLSFAQLCPTYDNQKTYGIDDCVYGNDGHGAPMQNYRGKQSNNRGNPPGTETTWWWEPCGTNNVICERQYTDTVTTDCQDTTYDTIQVLDTTNIYDTTIVNDTINDTLTTNIFDTTFVVDTVRTDTVVNDTTVLYDTTRVHVSVYDTTRVSVSLYDTTRNNVDVYDTTRFYDTTRTQVVVTDTIQRFDTTRTYAGLEHEVVDTFYITGFTEADNLIRLSPAGKGRSPVFVTNLDYVGLQPDDEVAIYVELNVYSSTGRWVDAYKNERIVEHEGGKLLEVVEWEIIDKMDGFLVTKKGRRYGTGAYIIKSYVRVTINNNIEYTNSDLVSFGYKRPGE